METRLRIRVPIPKPEGVRAAVGAFSFEGNSAQQLTEAQREELVEEAQKTAPEVAAELHLDVDERCGKDDEEDDVHDNRPACGAQDAM